MRPHDTTPRKRPFRKFERCPRCKRLAAEIEAAGLRFYDNGHCSECGAKYHRERRYKTPENHEREKANHRRFYQRHRERKLQEVKNASQRLRRAVIDAYGGRCACCGESQYEFLAIDHVNGGGNQHKKQLKSNSSSTYYRWLRDRGYPADFRILCHNCNLSLGNYGYCPHGGVEPVPMQPRAKAGRKRTPTG